MVLFGSKRRGAKGRVDGREVMGGVRGGGSITTGEREGGVPARVRSPFLRRRKRNVRGDG